MEDRKKIPALRFKGFEDEWEEKKLRELAKINPKGIIPDCFEYVDLESVSGTRLTGTKPYRSELAPSRAQRVAADGDIFYQTVRPYQRNNYLFRQVDEKKYIFSTGYAQLRANINEEFLFSFLQTDKFVNKVMIRCTGTSYPAINASDLGEITIRNAPSREEQGKIGSLLTELDNLIALQQEEYELLKKMKRGYLQKLFPKKGETVPELRFEGFDGAWEERSLGELLIERNIQMPQSESYPLVSFTVEKGVTPKTERYEREQLVRGDKLDKVYKVTEFNDIVYNPANLKFGAINRNKLGKAVFSPIYVTFEMKSSEILPSFMEYIVTNLDFISYALKFQQGTVYERQSVSPENLLSISVKITQKKEQEKIVLFISEVDTSLNNLKKQIESLKDLKKHLLINLFI